jgi:diguanylate cyclase (GGDEF)-like protein
MHLSQRDAATPISGGASLYDRTTRLYNRQGFILAGNHLLRGTSPLERWAFLLSLEVDQWRAVNQALGRDVGEGLLMQTAALLRGIFPRAAVIGRVGMDRFGVLARVDVPRACSPLLSQLIDSADRVVPRIAGLSLSLRGGFTQFDPQYAVSIPHLLTIADARMNALPIAARRKGH